MILSLEPASSVPESNEGHMAIVEAQCPVKEVKSLAG